MHGRPALRPGAFLAGLVAASLGGAVAGCQKHGSRPPAMTPQVSVHTSGAGLVEDDSQSTIEILTPRTAFPTPNPEVRWTALDAAERYDVVVSDGEDCTSPLQSFQTVHTSQVTSFLPNGVYYACVTAFGLHGEELAKASGAFWVMAHDVSDPGLQNGEGASGHAVRTPGLTTLPLFQDDWTSRQPNRDGHGARRDSVGAPFSFGAYADPHAGSKLRFVVNDRGNHRVLLFTGVPTRSDAPADVVVGQPDFESSRRNAGDHVNNSAFGDNVHASVCTDGKLLVTDRGNNRVLVWRQVPDANGAPADFVLGQADFVSSAPGTGPGRLSQPFAAYCLAGKVVVLDRGNHRLLVWNRLPERNGAAADYAVGQADLVSGRPGCAADRLDSPSEALLAGGRLYVADSGNNRVVAFEGFPSGFGAKAVLALGQPSLSSCRPNRGQAAGAETLSAPSSLAASGNLLAVADAGNDRVLLYQGPVTGGQDAAFVLGQPDAATTRRTEPPEMGSFEQPKGLLFDGNYLWVGDYGNRRLAVVPLPL